MESAGSDSRNEQEMKATAWIIAGSVGAVVLVGLTFRCLPDKPVRTRTTDTILLCRQILIGVDLMGGIIVSGEQDWGGESLNAQMATRLVDRRPGGIAFTNLVSPDGVFRDAWGTPLFFCLTNSVEFEALNPLLKGKHRALAVWSAGPDSTNELGFGDDVFSEY